MISVNDVTRVRLGHWVRVRLRNGDIIEGQVTAHHDNKLSRHSVKTVAGRVHVVDFPKDMLVKLSRNQFNTPVDPDAEIVARRVRKRKTVVNMAAYLLVFAIGLVTGAVGASLYKLNAVF